MRFNVCLLGMRRALVVAILVITEARGIHLLYESQFIWNASTITKNRLLHSTTEEGFVLDQYLTVML